MRQETRKATFEAREVFREAATLDPEYADAYAGIAWTYALAADRGWTEFVRDSIENAESLARQAVALDPDAVEGRRMLANVYRQKGEHDKAAAQLRLVLDINPSDADSYKDYGDILLWSGQAEKAIEWLEAALRLDPKMQAWAWSDLGHAYYLSGRYDEAVAAANQSIDRVLDQWHGPIVLSAAQAQLGHETKALEAAAQLLQVRPFFTVDSFIATIVDPDDAAHLADGLLKAGLPRSPTRQ